MPPLTSQEALQLASKFALTADRVRATADLGGRARLCDIASRVAFMRAQVLAKKEEIRPVFGKLHRRAIFAIA